jgi:hypothetical protein
VSVHFEGPPQHFGSALGIRTPQCYFVI